MLNVKYSQNQKTIMLQVI